MKRINDIANAPKAVGLYSQAVITHGSLVFCSGQVGLNPETGKLVEGGVAKEAEQVLANIKALLQGLNLSFDNIVKATVFLADINDFKLVNEIYGKVFPNGFPARSAVQVANLPLSARIEIEVIAEA